MNTDDVTTGKISAPAANQNTNPNAGAAQKRPAGAASDPPPVKTTPGQVRVSCVTVQYSEGQLCDLQHYSDLRRSGPSSPRGPQ